MNEGDQDFSFGGWITIPKRLPRKLKKKIKKRRRAWAISIADATTLMKFQEYPVHPIEAFKQFPNKETVEEFTWYIQGPKK